MPYDVAGCNALIQSIRDRRWTSKYQSVRRHSWLVTDSRLTQRSILTADLLVVMVKTLGVLGRLR